MRTRLALACVTALVVGLSYAEGEKPTRSIGEDLKRLSASRWLNVKPEASWNKLDDGQKKKLGGKPWKKVELEIAKLSAADNGRTHSVTPSFFQPGEEKSKFGITTYFQAREEKGKRFLVMTNLDGVEYKIAYEFQGDKLQLRGSYLHREPSSGAVFIPEVFDGDYVAIPPGEK
jgi:hypothetical protein